MKTAFRSLPHRSALAIGTLAVLVILLATLAINGSLGTTQTHAATTLPTPSHVVVVMEENHSFNDIIGSSSAPYINALANSGALFTNSFAITHPSEPNYLAIFSGSTQGLTDDSCPHTFASPDLGGELLNAGLTFGGYSEGLPSVGSTACTSGEYARKHSPWVNFPDVPSSDNRPFTSFPSNYNNLPTISFVIPNLLDDMHDGTIQQGDTWLQNNLSSYAQWAQNNHSLLIVTWDEDDSTQNNQIPTIFSGQMVKTGQYNEQMNHYNVLRTLEDMYGLPAANNSANASAITDCWQAASPTPTPTPSPTPTLTPTPSPTPTPNPGSNLVVNPGFENGSSPWKESSSAGYELVDTANPHTGSDSAYLCGYNNCNDQIWQSITLPSSFTTATLSYWTYISTSETSTSTCYDHLYAKLRTSNGTTIATVQSQCNLNTHGWTPYTFTVTSQLSAYAGQTIQVYFQGTTDYTLPTDFYVDDVALTVS